jgi:hypothetical protein
MLYPATGSVELLGAFQVTTTSYEEATPEPVRLTVAVGLLDELLEMVRAPVAAPVVVGSNSTVTVAVWFGFSVIGKVLPPEIENPVPLIVTEFTVTADPPVEVRVTDWDVGVFKFTLPNAMVVALMPSVAGATLSCSVKV